jgi:hypothetical protein
MAFSFISLCAKQTANSVIRQNRLQPNGLIAGLGVHFTTSQAGTIVTALSNGAFTDGLADNFHLIQLSKNMSGGKS